MTEAWIDKTIAPPKIAFWVVKTPWERWVGGMTRGKEALRAIEEIGGVICSLTRIPYSGMGFMPKFGPWKSYYSVQFEGFWPEMVFGPDQETMTTMLSLLA